MTNLYRAHVEWRNRPADERFRSLDELHASVKARDDASEDAQVQLTIEHHDHDREGPIASLNGTFTIHDFLQGRDVKLTGWAARQLAAKIGAPLEFLSGVRPDTASRVIADRIIRTVNTESLRVLDGGEAVVRAFHGDRYTRLWDSSVTRALQRHLPEHFRNPVAYERGEFGAELVPSGLYASDRDMFAFFINGGDMADLAPNAKLHQGFFVWNSEVGARSFGWTRFYFNMVCGNHIIWDASGIETIKARHVGRVAATFDSFVEYLLRLNGPKHDEIAAAVKLARATFAMKVPGDRDDDDMEHAIERFGDLGFTKHETREAVIAIRQEESGATGSTWDWLQGFTAAARRLPHIDARVDLEKRAAKALLPTSVG